MKAPRAYRSVVPLHTDAISTVYDAFNALNRAEPIEQTVRVEVGGVRRAYANWQEARADLGRRPVTRIELDLRAGSTNSLRVEGPTPDGSVHVRLHAANPEAEQDLLRLVERALGLAQASIAPAGSGEPQPVAVRDPRHVFVVHGRNLAAKEAMFTFLQSLGLIPREWEELIAATGSASPYIGEVLAVAFETAQAAVVLLTPDDEARLREPYRLKEEPAHETELTPQPRPNVLFEAGMAMGWADRRTVLVELGRTRPFSDVAGRHALRLTNDKASRRALVLRLRTAGCPVDLSSGEWERAGSFETPP